MSSEKNLEEGVMKKSLWIITCLAVLAGCWACDKGPEKMKIGLSLPTQREERWVRDKLRMQEAAQKDKIDLKIQISDNDAAKQIAQCENLIAQGIKVLIIAPHDATSASVIVQEAHKAGIKVISYDRLILNSEPDLYISFDNTKVGELQGKLSVEAIENTALIKVKVNDTEPKKVIEIEPVQ